MLVNSIRHDWPEAPGFLISRPHGLPEYTFLHFITPVRLLVDGQPRTLKPGACIWYSPHVPQHFQTDEDCIHNWAHFDPALAPLLSKYGIPENQPLFPQDVSFISSMFRMMEEEFFADHLHRSRMLDTLTEEFLLRFSRSLSGRRYSSVTSRQDRLQLSRLRNTILSRPEDNWTVSRMAGLLSLSPSRFHYVYKSVFGSSPMKDVIHARIIKAQSLLLTDQELDIARTAERLGYTDQYHFIRQFKAVTGETPASYRKKRQ